MTLALDLAIENTGGSIAILRYSLYARTSAGLAYEYIDELSKHVTLQLFYIHHVIRCVPTST